MKLITRGMGAVAAAMMLAAFVPAAQAAWTFNASDCSGEPASGSTSSTGATVTCRTDGTGSASGSNPVTISAWTTGSGSNFTAAKLGYYQNSATPADTEWGVTTGTSEGSPQHALDNDGKTEFLLFNFADSFRLTSFLTGWSSSDSDVTILAYTGNGTAPTTSVNGKTVESLVGTDGWELVGNCNNTNPTNPSSNNTSWYNVGNCTGGNTNLTSSWWIISAYNGNYRDPNTSGWDTAKDYVKIAAINGTFSTGTSVPEPATFGLLALGLAAAIGSMRQRGRRIFG